MLLAIVLSMAILFIWDYFFGTTLPPQETRAPIDSEFANPMGDISESVAPSVPSLQLTETVDREAIINNSDRIAIETESLKGSFELKGLRIDDLTLLKYRETLDPGSNNIILLSPRGSKSPYYSEVGWLSADSSLLLPSEKTLWLKESKYPTLTSQNPVILKWNNGEGIEFRRTISLDSDYMFTIFDEVENKSGKEISLYPYGTIARINTPDVLGFFILHEGPLGVFNDTLKEFDYSDLKKDKIQKLDSRGGWSGFTDKYWLTSLAHEESKDIVTSFRYLEKQRDHYQSDFITSKPLIIPNGESKGSKTYFFAGAKEVELLDRYSIDLGISRFDLAIDFGWFYFLTKPLFYGLIWLRDILGNFGLAILGLTVALRLLLFPLANKQFKAMTKLKKLQPEMKNLQERYGDDRAKLNQELMELYKREKANPAAGCLPILVQIPIFFALYKVLFVTIEMRQAPFYGWIGDMSAYDPTSIFNLFGLLPYEVPSFLVLGAWPIIMGITMWLQQRLNPAPTDPLQAKIMSFLPIIFTVMLARFPAGLVIYWAWSNALGIIQQWTIMRQAGVKA